MLNRERQRRDLDRELKGFVELLTQEKIRAGMSPEAARRAALVEVGGVQQVKEETRDVWAGVRLEMIVQDLRYALRSLRNQPAFTLAVIMVLALGIGANATMFGVIDRLLFRPPAHVAAPERVVSVGYMRTYDGSVSRQEYLSWPIYQDMVASTDAFSSVAAYSPAPVSAGLGSSARILRAVKVSANYFSTLGTQPHLGRFFVPSEDGPAPPNVVVISHAMWQRDYGGDRDVLGQAVSLGQTGFTIIGVAPENFTGVSGTTVDLWMPITSGVTSAELAGWNQSRNGFWLLAVARLREGVSPGRAEILARPRLLAGERSAGVTERRIAERKPGIGLVSVLPREALAEDPDSKVAILLGAVSLLVFAIACANVAGLQLARALRRRREIALRVTLGATGKRLTWQLLTESLVLSIVGGAGALFVASLGGKVVRDVLFTSYNWNTSVVDPRVLGFTLFASCVAGLMIGVLPVMQAGRVELAPALKEGAREGGGHRQGARQALLVLQTALSIVLLIGTGLFVRSLDRINALPIGMEPGRVLVADLRTSGTGYTTAQVHQLYSRLIIAARENPAVETAALALSIPFYSSWGTSVSVPGRDSLPKVKDGGPYFIGASDGYFETMGMRVVSGRGIERQDVAGASRVVVINESIARLWWPGENPIGKCMRIGGDTMPCSQVVGIVANARRESLIEDASLQFYLPIEQSPAWVDSRVVVIRPRGSPSDVA
ncbi:MAG TPA: ABC transporter permease, partial [Gemmatimonadaceae bacterium]|nr:ABC transporter permease [Gemmatimonadaceae bacterium]